jgi:carboxyl-terminal processing protease
MINWKLEDWKTWKPWMPLLLALALVTGMRLGIFLESEQPELVPENITPGSAMKYMGNGRLEELIRYIDAKYVDDVDDTELVEDAIDHLLSNLDPHSSYISREDMKFVNEQLHGAFDGIGVEFLIIDDSVAVVKTMPGGPAEKAGILDGDRIVQVGDSTLTGDSLNIDKVVDMLRGERGTKVMLKIVRHGLGKMMVKNVVRDKIVSPSIDMACMLDGETGYVKLNRFSSTTSDEFAEVLDSLVELHNMKNLVLDLRQNPGGYLQEATNILSQLFSERGKLLVYTEGQGKRRVDYETTGRVLFEIGKVACLIDESSASSSEILAGALQDWDRAVIVGRRSFGKGLVQEQYTLRDGSALRLTVAKYYTPSGRLIQKPYADAKEYAHDVLSRLESGEMQDEKKIPHPDTTKYYTAAGRVVYGGGGITPDVYVPVDTALYSMLSMKLLNEVPQFIFKYLEDHPSFTKPAKFEQFEKLDLIDAEFFQQFLAFAAKQGVKTGKKIPAVIEKNLRLQLRAHLARQWYGEWGYFQVLNNDDPVVKEALKTMSRTDLLVQKK